MPIPKPGENESNEDFMGRCMNDETMLEDYPDGNQRMAVCATTWENNKEANMSDLKKKKINVVTKVMDEEQRIIRFIASDEGYDRDNDRISVAGWELTEYMTNPVFLYMHNYEILPLGKCVSAIKDTTAKQLIMDIQFPTVEEMASGDAYSEHALFVDTVYNMYKNGYLHAVSVGFRAYDGDKNDQGGYDFTNQKLFELSAVTVPANPNAIMIGAKSLDKAKSILEDFNKGEEVEKEIKKLNKDATLEDIFNYYTESIMSIIHEADAKQSKGLDFMGNPSHWDIESMLDRALPDDAWSLDHYSDRYPSGHVVVVYVDRLNDYGRIYKMHDYEYIKDFQGNVSIEFGEGVELDPIPQWTAKALEKSGAVLSASNMTSISEAMGDIKNGLSRLQGVLDGAQRSDGADDNESVNKDVDDDPEFAELKAQESEDGVTIIFE